MTHLPTDDELKQFVRLSNAKEGIDADPGDILYDNHLMAAKMVRDDKGSKPIPPKRIHELLMFGTMTDAGHYRTGELCMVSRETGAVLSSSPRASAIGQLMFYYQKLVQQTSDTAQKIIKDNLQDEVAWTLHHFGLCIHPFRDGNGRTFRLVLNYWRQRLGLAWYVLPLDGFGLYDAKIAAFEKQVFFPKYAWAYPS